jgi:glutamine amidotransferase
LEYGTHQGLGLIPGQVIPLAPEAQGRKVPHMGWNSLDILKPEDPLMAGIPQGAYVYYVHSYYATQCDEALVATSAYGAKVAGVVRRGSVCGTQFHPEKSGEVGLAILASFAKGGV